MCKITIVDYNINIYELQRILLINALSGNEDGFGFYNPDKDLLWKSKESYVSCMYEAPLVKNNLKGIYHVRKASLLNKESKVEDSHPFLENNLVVVHNGTLNFRYTHKDCDIYEKDCIKGEHIDSLKYTKVLAKIVENEILSFKHIEKATNLFAGAFVLVHFDKKDKQKKLWISRGKDRTLYKLLITTQEKVPVGIIFNTSFLELFQYLAMLEIMSNYKLTGEIVLLSENTTYSYILGSFNLVTEGKIEQDSTFVSKTYVCTTPAVTTSRPYSSSLVPTIYNDILRLCTEMSFSYLTLINIYEHAFNKSIVSMTPADLVQLEKLLVKLQTNSGKTKLVLWRKILEETSIQNAYNQLEFPFLLNSTKELKLYYRHLKEA